MKTRTSGKFAAIAALVASLVLAFCLVGCGGGSNSASSGPLKDGSYTGQSEVYKVGADGDGYVIVSITVKDGKIETAEAQAFEPDGTLKDENYGKGTDKYSLAQKVVSYIDDYSKALVETGSADVDLISGATYLHDQFVDAAKKALDQAKA